MKKQVSKTARITAIICIVIIILTYITTLILSFMNFIGSDQLMIICFGATLIFPILAWLYIYFYGVITKKHTMADFDLMGNPTNRNTTPDIKSANDDTDNNVENK